MLSFIRYNNLWDRVYFEPGTAVPKRRLLYGLTKCPHATTIIYSRTDHRPGPGWMSDSYEGTCCADCGRVLSETLVY